MISWGGGGGGLVSTTFLFVVLPKIWKSRRCTLNIIIANMFLYSPCKEQNIYSVINNEENMILWNIMHKANEGELV